MDLSRGICIFCINNTKIIVPPQAENTTFLLKDILGDQIDYEKFEKINPFLKACPMCINDVITVAEHRQNIKEEFSEDRDSCVLCCSNTLLVRITDWTHFDKTLQNITTEKRVGKCFACLSCIKCLDLLERIKNNLFKKYPYLEVTKRVPTTTKKNPKTKLKIVPISSDEETDYPSQNRANAINNLTTALQHLKPLKNSKFNTDRFKQDKKLVKQIAFVKLSVSNLSTKDYKQLGGGPERSWRLNELSDTDSSRDSPTPKHSFFKIKLKINPSKVKSQRVKQSRVTKPKDHKSKPISERRKELVVKIMKMNFDKISNFEFVNSMEIQTPTKASRKMLPEGCKSDSKKRKSVTFADVDTEILEGRSRKDNAASTPLRSLLKKDVPFKSGLSDSDSDNENNKRIKKESSPDVDEELETPKSYVDEIMKNNDSIFDNLKTPESTTAKPAKESGHSFDNSSDSETEKKPDELGSENNIIDKTDKTQETRNKSEVGEKNRTQIEVEDSEDEEDKTRNKEINEKDKQEPVTKSTKRKEIEKTKIMVLSDSDNNESAEEKEENNLNSTKIKENEKGKRLLYSSSDEDLVTKSENKEEEEGDITNVKQGNNANISNKSHDNEIILDDASELHNKKDKKKDSHRLKKSKKAKSKHKKRKRSSSTSDSNIAEKRSKDETRNLSGNEEHQSKVRSDVGDEISLSKCFQAINKPNGSETSLDDKDVTLEEFKALRQTNLEDTRSEKVVGTNFSVDDTNEDSDSETLILHCEDITETINTEHINDKAEDHELSVTETKDKGKRTEKNSSDIESDSAKNINSNGSYDSSNLKSKSKKQPKCTEERQKGDEEVFNIIRACEESEEPETKREQVSGVDDLSKTDSNASRTKEKDIPLEIPETQRDVGAIDNKLEELLAKYANPSIPNLNNDNVSDSQNVGVSGENRGRKSEVPSSASEEEVDLPRKCEVISEKSTENVDTIFENNGISDITKNSDAQERNVTLKELDINDVIKNIGDSC